MTSASWFEGHRVSLRLVRALDVLVVVWVLGWVAVAVLVAVDVHRLVDLAVTEANAASALQQLAGGLKPLSHLPVVGGDLAKLSAQVTATVSSAKESAASSRAAVVQLSWLLGVVIAVIPGVPLLAAYLPFRLSRVREAQAMRAALRTAVHPARLEQYLAARALTNLPYHRLVQISEDPWLDFAQGRFAGLASAELSRLGFVHRRNGKR